MRRFSGDVTLADDLAQITFLQGWQNIRHVQRPGRFGAWLKRIAINVWLQYLRKNDPLRQADEHIDSNAMHNDVTGIGRTWTGPSRPCPETFAFASCCHITRV